MAGVDVNAGFNVGQLVRLRADRSKLGPVMEALGIVNGAARYRVFHSSSDIHPREFELLVLKTLVPTDANDMIRFREMVEIYRGFEASMQALHDFIQKRILHFEEGGDGLPKPDRSRSEDLRG